MINYRCYLSYQRFSNGISCWRYEISMQLALRRLDDDWMTASTTKMPRVLRRCRCSTVGNCRRKRYSLWSPVRTKCRIVSNGSTSHRKWPRALRRRDPWGNVIARFTWSASLSLSLSLCLYLSIYLSISLSLFLCDVSTANEFLIRVPTGIWRSIVPAARQILDFDITGLIDEYDTNRPCRIGDFVWLPLPVRGISSDTQRYIWPSILAYDTSPNIITLIKITKNTNNFFVQITDNIIAFYIFHLRRVTFTKQNEKLTK